MAAACSQDFLIIKRGFSNVWKVYYNNSGLKPSL